MPRNFVSTGTWFSPETFFNAMLEGCIVDGRKGGLLIGRPHTEGGIHIFSSAWANDKLIFPMTGELEGHEFIVNPVAYLAHKTRLEEINSFQNEHPTLSNIMVSPTTRIINTSSQPNDRLLWVENDSFIVNKYATAMHLNELEQLNEANEAITTFSYDFFINNNE